MTTTEQQQQNVNSSHQESLNKDEEKALEDIDILLNETRPRHIVDGVTSGIGYIVAGAIGACGILVLSPKVGATTGYEKTDGNWLGGLVGGLVGGVVGVGSAVSVTVGGIFTGLNQTCRGIINTPASIIQPRKGKWWSVYEGKWIKTHLKSEKEWIDEQPEFDEDILGDEVVPEEKLLERSDVKEKRARAIQYNVKDTELYDIMGVDPDATEDEIKRRYNQVGKLFSPTRQGADNPAAKARFQQISNAFVVLTNKEMRARYDKYGQDGIYGVDSLSTEDNDLINPQKLYNIMYGSEKFQNYTGRLAAASEATVGIEKSSKITLVEARQLQKRRVTRLALHLAERLKKWTKGAQEEAKDDWNKEAEILCDANYGKDLVHVIGSAYSLSAVQFLGSFESGIGMPSISRWANRQYKALTHHGKTHAKKVENFAGDVKGISVKHEAKKGIASSVNTFGGDFVVGNDSSVTAELFESIGKDVLEMLWTRTVVDITNTIHEACQMVLFDADLNDETRKLRGEGLEVLGEIFQNADYGQSSETKESEASYEEIAFYAVLDTIRKQEIASRNAA